MKIRNIALIFLSCLVLFSSCTFPQPSDSGALGVPGTPPSPTPQPGSTLDLPIPSISPPTLAPTPIPSLAVSPFPTSLPASPTVAPSVTPPLPSSTPALPAQVPAQYDLDAIFDYELHSLSVAETITYKNLASDPLTDLILIVEPNLIPGGFALTSIAWGDGSTIDIFTLEENQLHLTIPQPLQPGDTSVLKLNYQLAIPELTETSESVRPIAYGYSARQTNIVDWYPYVPPYRDGTGWLVHPYWFWGEYQVYDVADFNVNITLAQPVPELVMAASVPAQNDGEQYSYHLETARTFALSASTEYLVNTTTVGDVTINSYSFAFDKYSGQQVLHDTASAVQLFSRLILPYPRSSLSVVEADFLDGMEYDGLFFLSHGFYDLYDGTPKGYLTFIAAHEAAHQWWYGLVANDQALEPWLDEAMCTYMERIFYENVYSDYPPHSGSSLVDWWWYYRVNFYAPTGWVNGSIYDFNQFRAYRNAVYLNGAYFFEDLRKLIGDQAFFAFLRDYANKEAHSIATGQDFFTILRSHTSQDLQEILTTYFQSKQ